MFGWVNELCSPYLADADIRTLLMNSELEDVEDVIYESDELKVRLETVLQVARQVVQERRAKDPAPADELPDDDVRFGPPEDESFLDDAD